MNKTSFPWTHCSPKEVRSQSIFKISEAHEQMYIESQLATELRRKEGVNNVLALPHRVGWHGLHFSNMSISSFPWLAQLGTAIQICLYMEGLQQFWGDDSIQ